MEEVTLLGSGPHAGQVWMENPVEPCPAPYPACRPGKRFDLNIIRVLIFGDLHEEPAYCRSHHCPHLVLFLDWHFCFAKGCGSLCNCCKGHGSGCAKRCGRRVVLCDNVSINTAIKHFARRFLHETALVALRLEDVETCLPHKVMPLSQG